MNTEQANKYLDELQINDKSIFDTQDNEHPLDYLLEDYHQEQLKLFSIHIVSNWVAISSTEQPEIMTDVMVKYKDGRKEVAFFDGDCRFYKNRDDWDITDKIVEWHKLP